jgi:hypothetical protein
MTLFGTLRVIPLSLLLVSATLPQRADSLNVNYNATTMWLYNYFRAYICVVIFPDTFCDGLAGARDEDVSQPPPASDPLFGSTFTNEKSTNTIDAGSLAFGDDGSRQRHLRSGDAWHLWWILN